MTKHPDLFAALSAPFEPGEVKSRSQGGRQLHYITARTAMNRLDSVLGPEGWWDSYRPGGDSSVVCRLTIVLPDGRELSKEDAGGAAGMADAGDDDKSQYSDAFKRAAVKFGVARYLYRDGVPSFVQERTAAAVAGGNGKPADLGWVHNAPETPASPAAIGTDNGRPSPVSEPERPRRPAGEPRTGKQLFGWAKDREASYGVGVLKYLTQWAKLQDFPARMVEWNADQVALGYREASRKLATLQPQPQEQEQEAAT